MSNEKKALASRLWSEWTNGLKILSDSLVKDQIEIVQSTCTCVIGNENFLQKTAIYMLRKKYIGKFDDYKSRIGAYERTIQSLLNEVNELVEEKVDFHSTLQEICIDTETDLANESWGDNAIAAYEKLGNYVNNLMDVLDKAQKEVEK